MKLNRKQITVLWGSLTLLIPLLAFWGFIIRNYYIYDRNIRNVVKVEDFYLDLDNEGLLKQLSEKNISDENMEKINAIIRSNLSKQKELMLIKKSPYWRDVCLWNYKVEQSLDWRRKALIRLTLVTIGVIIFVSLSLLLLYIFSTQNVMTHH